MDEYTNKIVVVSDPFADLEGSLKALVDKTSNIKICVAKQRSAIPVRMRIRRKVRRAIQKKSRRQNRGK